MATTPATKKPAAPRAKKVAESADVPKPAVKATVAKAPVAAKTTKTPATAAKSGSLSIGVYDLAGKKVKSIELPSDIFDITASERLIAQYIRVYLANQRQGTVSTKTRAEVDYTTKKMYRQKGTGRARHGAKSAPIFVGGGVAFGPKPKTYNLSMNKKQRRRALFAALTKAFKGGVITGLTEEVINVEPKTAKIAAMLKARKIERGSTLIVLPKMENNHIVQASRNIPSVELTDATSLNAYTVLNARNILFAESALDVLTNHFLKKSDEN